MIKGKALRVQDRHYVERWVEVDKSTRGNDKRSGESYGPNHNCYRGVIRCDGKKIRKRFPTYVAARAWVENWHRAV